MSFPQSCNRDLNGISDLYFRSGHRVEWMVPLMHCPAVSCFVPGACADRYGFRRVRKQGCLSHDCPSYRCQQNHCVHCRWHDLLRCRWHRSCRCHHRTVAARLFQRTDFFLTIEILASAFVQQRSSARCIHQNPDAERLPLVEMRKQRLSVATVAGKTAASLHRIY